MKTERLWCKQVCIVIETENKAILIVQKRRISDSGRPSFTGPRVVPGSLGPMEQRGIALVFGFAALCITTVVSFRLGSRCLWIYGGNAGPTQERKVVGYMCIQWNNGNAVPRRTLIEQPHGPHYQKIPLPTPIDVRTVQNSITMNKNPHHQQNTYTA